MRVNEVGDAIREGRAAKANRERQLRAVVDHRAESMTDHVGPGDTLLVDGEPVDAGRVIVLRDQAQMRPAVAEPPLRTPFVSQPVSDRGSARARQAVRKRTWCDRPHPYSRVEVFNLSRQRLRVASGSFHE